MGKLLLKVILLVLTATLSQAQTLTYSNINSETNAPLGPGEIELTLDELAPQVDNLSKYNNPSYYQAFVIYGDGNYRRFGSMGNPILNNRHFAYSFREMENDYPGCVLMISRKDDKEPPPPDENLIFPPDDIIPINAQSTNVPPIRLNTTFDTWPPQNPSIDHIPLIIEENNWLEMGFSHYHKSGDTGDGTEEIFFLQGGRTHALPIAFRSVGKGILLFFYKVEDNIHYGNSIVPNYYHLNDLVGTSTSSSTIYIDNKKDAINNNFTSDNFDIPGEFKCVSYPINNEDSKLLTNNGLGLTKISPPIVSAADMGELRIFHFLNTDNSFDDSSSVARFVAVLYDERCPKEISPNDNIFIESIGGTLPSTLVVDEQRLCFSDYSLLNAQKGEPDDPGGLHVESICQCGEDYIVTFNLEFCNSDGAFPAKAVDVFIKSNSDQGQAIAMDIQLVAGCPHSFPSDAEPCTQLEDCNTLTNQLDDPDRTYCFNFSGNGLESSECGYLRFTAKIGESNINKLINESIINYCVKFWAAHERTGAIDVGEYCLPNTVLKDSICYNVPKDSFSILRKQIRCESNLIWEDRIESCSEELLTQYECPRRRVLVPLILGFLMTGGILFWLFGRRTP